MECLNPYYTGIHLHKNSSGREIELLSVLILIILEYIYIKMEEELIFIELCLNPYYTGIHLHSSKTIAVMGNRLS